MKHKAVCLMIAGAFLSVSAVAANGSSNSSQQAARPWTNRSLTALQRTNLLIKEMTLDEKIILLHGVDPLPAKAYVGYVPPNQRLGIPAITLADGRAGVGNGATDVTLLPSPIAAASSWNPDLLHDYGKLLGEEQWGKGTNVELGPSIDVVRVPEWGRTFESYGEDPYFNARMAVAEVDGIQEAGPIADANMYLTMNQESNRFKEDSMVDQRTLQEIYLPPFAAAIEQGHVGTVMCAYVKTNGVYSCENANLLTEMLRQQLHFDGWVMSDWGATHSTLASVKNGLDQEMPGAKYFGVSLKAAVTNGQVSTAIVDEHVRRILLPMFQHGLFDKTQTGNWASNVRTPEHDVFSRMAAEQGTILLKNERDLLPLTGKESIAVIGEAGDAKPKVAGGGSSGMIAPYVISPLQGIRKRAGAGAQVVYANGIDLAKAADTARRAEVAIVFVHTDEKEGEDRANLDLPGNQNQLISTVAAANRETIVVLDTGGPVLMPWIAAISGLIEAWYPGQEDGNVIAAVLYGDVNPSARLPLSFPRTATAIPTSKPAQWPGIDGRSKYSEKLNVGYRWYDATHTEPLFPFGFGLSYTTFNVGHLVVTPASLAAGGQGGSVKVTVDVTNTGKRPGAEVVQVYVQHPVANAEPPHQLRAFGRVQLAPGETKPVTLTLDPSSFSIYDLAAKRWVSPAGTYEILAGTSSRDLPLHANFVIGSHTKPIEPWPGWSEFRFMNDWKARALLVCLMLHAACCMVRPAAAETSPRTTLSLDGQWDVEDSTDAGAMPTAYSHKAPVPGLAHSAVPVFPDVDQYQSRELLLNLVQQKRYAQADYDKLGSARGISHQKRNYFWYRRTFTAPARDAVALLKISKAQFGTVVYLNGTLLGEHDSCFTAAYFDVTKAIHWQGSNELVIRIGAHPGVLPANVSQGTDFEKNRWTPGIYDDVSLWVMNNPVIATVQVAPQLASASILVQTELHNYSGRAITTKIYQQVVEWKSLAVQSKQVQTEIEVPPGASKTVLQTVSISTPHLWTPEDPFLYKVSTTTDGDRTETRFGMREFRFDTATQRAYLNGHPYFLRGSNITLHRFFEDPQSATLPWDEAWLHRLLVEIPKQLHWNAFRFCIGPVPDRWLQIADENGLLIQNEYMVWTGHPDWNWGPGYRTKYDTQEMISEYSEWMRDNWNHPSVAIWDASNESWLPQFSTDIIPHIRQLDLSNRPWENSYNVPAGPDDPVEDHQYLFYGAAMDDAQTVNKPGYQTFKVTDLESMMGPGPSSPTMKSGHALILNEYGWLWLNRDGTPTLLTDKLYPRLLGDKNTTENRVALAAYLLGGETEFWRAYRRYAGILHFVYLTASDPRAFTSDEFQNLQTLQLEPHFAKAIEQAFNPLGVYLNFWQPVLPTSEPRAYIVAMVNDENRARAGTLRLAFIAADGKEAATQDVAFALSPIGAQSYVITMKAPAAPGEYRLQAIASADDDKDRPTISSRNVILQTSVAKQ